MTIILLFLSVFAATVPMLGFLALIWWLDRYNREPIPLLLAVFAWGSIFAVLGALTINSFGAGVLNWLTGEENTNVLVTMFLAPIVEVPMKAIILLAVTNTRWFDNTTDGFVYGAAAGLGFAMTENYLYFQAHSDQGLYEWLYVVFVRTACSGLMHAMATSVVGAALGWAHCRTRDVRIVAFCVGLGVAILIHAVWNILIVLELYIGGQAILLDVAIFGLEFSVVTAIFLLGIQREKRMIIGELMEEARGGVLPPQHVHIIASVRRRRRHGWCPPSVDQTEYIQLATKLAFKRMQCRQRGPHQERFSAEARTLRHALRHLLGTRPLPPISEAGPR